MHFGDLFPGKYGQARFKKDAFLKEQLMAEIGYSLSSEEHPPLDLVRFAQRAEQAGFSFALISDHFHPWIGKQGQSPFVWSVIGGIACTTEYIRLGTGVTCPTMRIHPAIVAQAAATAAAMMPGRFFLGVGTGENQNEHILGQKWPPNQIREEMLKEAVEVIRLLWGGELQSYRGNYYTVENARIFTLPQEPPPIYVAAAGEKSAQLAAEIGDGLAAAGGKNVAKIFIGAGGNDKPRYCQVHVCWSHSEDQARKMAREVWPTSAMSDPLNSELALPSYFESVAEMVSEFEVEESIICGPDPQRHIRAIADKIDEGFDHIYLHQIGKDQEGFFQFYESDVLPEFGQGVNKRLAS
jgi:G6PDH family F420-dependent oxidoreductase